MARHTDCVRLRREKGRRTYLVRFRVNGERVEKSTGASTQREAQRAAEQIYADAVQRTQPQARRRVARGDAPPLVDLIATWLDTDKTLDPDTAEVWMTYGAHWCRHFVGGLVELTEVNVEDYRDRRLGLVRATTVRKELGALRRFINWAHKRGHLARVVEVPSVPTSSTGTAHTARRRVAAPDLTVEQIEALLAALPEWSTSKRVARFPIRARFRLQYETGLRPSTIDALETPTHWHRGSKTLTLTDDVDKARWGRVLPLTPLAIKALSACAPEAGIIFGKHDYREHIAAAAAAALPKAVADKFTGAHLRSARSTHLLEAGATLPAVAYLVGHKKVSTTSGYVRATFRAAEAALEAIGGHGPNTGGTRPKRRSRKRP